MRRTLELGRLGRLAGCCALALSFANLAPAAAAMADGKTFAVSTGEAGKPANDKDELIFKDDSFRSTACDTYGFGAAPYTAATAPDRASLRFSARTTSAKEGVIRWQGDVRGDAISGTYVWEKAGQRPISYWFKGTLKKRPA